MNTLKYIIVGVVLYTITACTATHYTVIESKGYTIPVTERLDASPDASVAEIINIYKTKVDSITELSVEFHFRFVSGNCRKKYRKEM